MILDKRVWELVLSYDQDPHKSMKKLIDIALKVVDLCAEVQDSSEWDAENILKEEFRLTGEE